MCCVWRDVLYYLLCVDNERTRVIYDVTKGKNHILSTNRSYREKIKNSLDEFHEVCGRMERR